MLHRALGVCIPEIERNLTHCEGTSYVWTKWMFTGRGVFVVKQGSREAIADIVLALASRKVTAFKMVRIKNRFDPSETAESSAGYRDCQTVLMAGDHFFTQLHSGWRMLSARLYYRPCI